MVVDNLNILALANDEAVLPFQGVTIVLKECRAGNERNALEDNNFGKDETESDRADSKAKQRGLQEACKEKSEI